MPKLDDYINTPARRPNNAMQRERVRQLGNLEYFAALRSDPSGGEWSRLGTKVAGAGFAHKPAAAMMGQFVSSYPFRSELEEFASVEGKYPTFNTIYTGTGRSVPAVQTHEFRHAAAEYIKENYTKDDFVKRWGPEAGAVYNLITQPATAEGAVEVFDIPEAGAGTGKMAETIQFLEGPLGFMPQELRGALRRKMETISSDIMGDIGVPPRAKRLDR